MTRDEFLDIMGEIDPKLIERTLDISDISRGKAVRLQYERASVWKNIAGIAACIAILATAFTVGYFRSIPTQSGESSGATYNESSVPEIIRGWDPEDLVYSDKPILGANMRVSVAELDGITAELILHNIKKEAGIRVFINFAEEYIDDMMIETEDSPDHLLLYPSDYDYFNDYVGAEDIVLYVHDDKGRRFIETSVTPHSYNGMELISVNCLFDDCTRLYKVEGEYVLMQYADDIHYNNVVPIGDPSLYLARFYKLDLTRQIMRDENGIYTGGLVSVKVNGDRQICNWEYGCPVTRGVEYIGEKRFFDSAYNNVIYWDNQGDDQGIKFYTSTAEQIVQMVPYPHYQP